MLLARRKFIRIFSASAVLFCANAQLGLARTLLDDSRLSDEVLRDPVYSFTRETFKPYIGGYFEAHGARGEMVPLKLVSVDSYKPSSRTKLSARTLETESFSLQFEAEGTLPSSTDIHQIKHGALGEFKLFLSRLKGPNSYEAVFNRLR